MSTSKMHGLTPRLSEAARHLVIPSGIVTTGWPPVESRLADMAISFDFWQQGMAKVALGKRADGKYAATIGGVVMSIPRQVGKTFSVGALLVALAIEFPGLRVLWTAHRTRTATNTFQSMQRMVKRKRIWPHVEGIRLANGEQEIRFLNGSVVLFGAREQGFGRGFDEIDVIVFDEAQILTEKALEDMVAATNQSRHPHGALIFFIGTPPRPVDPGEAFTFKRMKALSGKSDDMVFIEFSAEPKADLDDRKQWAKANPSFPQRTPLESMLRLRENLPSDDAWRREALGIWDEISVHLALVSASKWLTLKVNPADPLEDRALPAEDRAPAALGLDMSHARSVAISGAWLMDERTHVEVLSLGELDTTTAVEWLRDRAGRRIPVVVDNMSPAASMIPALEKAKVKVVSTSANEMGKACGSWFDLVKESKFSHIGQSQLDAAVAGARKRPIGKAGLWGLDRADNQSDISSLVSVVLAVHGAVSKSKPERRSRVVVYS